MKEFFRVNVSKYVAKKEFDVVRPASLNHPKDNAVMFVTESYVKNIEGLLNCRECLVFWPVQIELPEEIKIRHAVVLCDNPHTEFCRFYQVNHISYLPPKEEVNYLDGAWISSKASIGTNVTIMPGVYIGGDCVIGNNVYIGAGVKIVGSVWIGNNVVIRENTVIGADGLTTDREGKAITMIQFGGVIIEDDVQIGANVVIARGAIDNTKISRGAKIDSACFVSHNVTVGEDSFIVGETILFGSSSVGKRCLVSGNCTIANTVRIGNNTVLGMGSTALKDIPDNVIAFGSPIKVIKDRF